MSELKFIKIDARREPEEERSSGSCCPAGVSTDRGQKEQRAGERLLAELYDPVPHWITGTVHTQSGAVYQVSTEWTAEDRRGRLKSRVSAFRMNYSVCPGLYAVGNPDGMSDVFATASYKLSFDMLRRSLRGMNAWILVLDTKSINVWCAAGKGTFGTDELVRRIGAADLRTVVDHRRIIVPQLGAPGVHGREVQRRTGFRVLFGPVRTDDIPAYVKAGYRASPEMRTIRFSIRDRMVLTPMELNPALKKFPLFAAIVLIIFGLHPTGVLFADALAAGMPFVLYGLVAVVAGAFITPVLLPFIPFRSFAIKGLIVGLLAVFIVERVLPLPGDHRILLSAVTYTFFPVAASYIALQFTGSTTFTGISGVRKELRIALPAYIGCVVICGLLLVIYKLGTWGVI